MTQQPRVNLNTRLALLELATQYPANHCKFWQIAAQQNIPIAISNIISNLKAWGVAKPTRGKGGIYWRENPGRLRYWMF